MITALPSWGRFPGISVSFGVAMERQSDGWGIQNVFFYTEEVRVGPVLPCEVDMDVAKKMSFLEEKKNEKNSNIK